MGFQWHERRPGRYSAGRASMMCAAMLTWLLPANLAAQKLLDWPVRTGATPEVVSGGAGGIFWNPATVGWVERRGEALLMDIRGPAAAEVGGIAAAATVRVSDRVALSAGYHHLGLDGMSRTTRSPDSHGDVINIGEDVVRLGSAWMAGDSVWAGMVVEHWRSNPGGSGTRLGAGLAYHGGGAWQPALAIAWYTGKGTPRWMVGTEVRRPVTINGPVLAKASYGLTGDGRLRAPGHRGALSAEWGDRVRVAAGVTLQPNGDVVHVEPLYEARLRLGSYTLSVVRDELASGFGAAHYLGLGFAF